MEYKAKYTHGDDYYICAICGSKEEVNMLSSAGIMDIIHKGWVYWIEEKVHTTPGKMIRREYTGDRWVKTKSKIEKIIRLKCDACILIGERVDKIKKIKERLNG